MFVVKFLSVITLKSFDGFVELSLSYFVELGKIFKYLRLKLQWNNPKKIGKIIQKQ